MWIFEQLTGNLSHDGELVGKGYSGHPPNVNNPAAQDIHDSGPIPQGLYSITPPHDSKHGPYTLGLTPHNQTELYGRSGFLIHGDRIDAPGKQLASLGCIIVSKDVRVRVWLSGDHILKVIDEPS